MNILCLIAGLFTLTLFHELGHVVSAFLLRLRIYNVGIAMFPYPHPYVKVEHTDKRTHRYIFYYAGIGMTVLLLIVSYLTGLLSYKMIYYAFAIELIIELNPFHSDIFLVHAEAEDYGKFNFSLSGNRKYYFFFWLALIYLFFNPLAFQKLITFY